jgi:branched-chain amino acid transport system ATP-binding protein
VLRPTAGTIHLEGRDITGMEAHKRVQLGIARTFQINQLFGDLTPLETIGLAVSERMELGRQWWRVVGSKGVVIEESVELLERFHLRRRDGRRAPRTCRTASSACSRSRSPIACRPRVLLLDEPAAGVPEAERHDILERRRGVAEGCHRTADRARHGHRVLVRRPHLGAGQRRAVVEGPAGRSRRRSLA